MLVAAKEGVQLKVMGTVMGVNWNSSEPERFKRTLGFTEMFVIKRINLSFLLDINFLLFNSEVT